MDSRCHLPDLAGVCVAAAHGDADLEVRITLRDTYVTRFSKSVVFQDMGQHEMRILLKAIVDGREFSVSTNHVEPELLHDATRTAIEGARSWGTPNLAGLSGPKPVPEVSCAAQATLECTAADRSRIVSAIVTRCQERGVEASGLLTVRKREVAVANTAGILVCTPMTEVVVNIVASSPTSTGYATLVSKDLAEVNPVKLADRAIDRCLSSQNPIRLEPDTFEVILEPSAVASMLLWCQIGFGAFGARAAATGSSVLYNNIGNQLFGSNVTIYDDATAPDTLTMPFDFEGTPKRKTELITCGVPMGVVHDRTTAHELGVESTGHCTPYDEGPTPDGPAPLNTIMEGGDCTVEDMIRNTKRGILVTRFHGAVAVLDPANLLLSGTTRDGTFLIEDGKVKCGVKPLRWTDSVVDAFSAIEMLSRDTQLVSPPHDDMPAVTSFRVPALKISSLRFTDVQDF